MYVQEARTFPRSMVSNSNKKQNNNGLNVNSDQSFNVKIMIIVRVYH